MFLHIILVLDRLHSIAAGFEDRFFSIHMKGGKSHFKIFESLLVTLDFLIDLKHNDEHLSLFCFELSEHKFFSVKIRGNCCHNTCPFLPCLMVFVGGGGFE